MSKVENLYRKNKTRNQMARIASMGNTRRFFIQMVTSCPWCGKYGLKLKEKHSHFFCMNCGETGDLDEVEAYMTEKLLKEKRGVLQ